ncbi:hypothetical protein Tco_0208620, partial [Tanacetum coccineum]
STAEQFSSKGVFASSRSFSLLLCLKASPYSTSKDIVSEVDADFAQESQEKKQEQEEAKKK